MSNTVSLGIACLSIFIGCIIANYLYALVTSSRRKDAYEKAFERSFFQGIALLILYLSSKT